MKILVTGATGLLGNNVVRKLLANGHTVRVLARTTSDPRPFEGLPLEKVAGDIEDADAVTTACQGVDGVVHSAGLVQIGWHNAERFEAVNVGGARNVAVAARAAGCRLVHVSTVNALGVGRRDQPADEERVAGPNIACPYVVSKQRAETAVQEEVARGLWAVIVSPGLMFGPWDWKPSSGQMILEVATRFTPFAPTGGCSVCDVRDVADGILAAVTRGQPGRRYILAGENLRYVEIWRQIAKVAAARGPWCPAGPLMRIVAGRFGDLWSRLAGREPNVNSAAVRMSNLYHYFSSARAEQELGYRSRPAQEAIAAAWQWFQTYGYV